MTTIAYKKGVMACDSAYTYNDMVVSKMTKIKMTSAGCLFGSAGGSDARRLEDLVDGVFDPSQLPTVDQLLELEGDQDGLLVFPSGRVFLLCACINANDPDAGVTEIVGYDSFAIGTGGPVARAAMRAGASPTEAIEIACELDINSREPVHVLNFPLESDDAEA